MSAPDPDLNDFARQGCPDAFRRLVERHVDAVHSTAARLLRGWPEDAADVTQGVFILLARKAPQLGRDMVVAAWLHRQTVRLALNARRADARRAARERTAVDLIVMNSTAPNDSTAELQIHVDEAVHALPRSDREMIALHYFDRCQQREIAARMGLSPDAVQKRLSRALDRVRQHLARRGAAVPAAALAAWFSGSAVKAAPAALSRAIAAQTLPHAAAVSSFTSTLIAIMTHTKAITVGAALGLAAGGFQAAWSAQATPAFPPSAVQAFGKHDTSSPVARGGKNPAFYPDILLVPADTTGGLVARMQEFAKQPNTEPMRLRMNAWMAQIPPEMWPEFFQLVHTKLSEWENYNYLPVLAQGWGRIAPASAIPVLADLQRLPRNTRESLAGNAFRIWHETDATAAQRWLMEHQDDAGLSSELLGFVETIAGSLFAKSENDLIAWAARLGGADLQGAALTPLILSLAENPNDGAPRLCSLFLGHADPAFSGAALQTVLKYWIHGSSIPRQWPDRMAAVNAWLAGLPQGPQAQMAAEQVLRRVATAPGHPAPETALKLLRAQSPPESESLARRFVLESKQLNPTAKEWLLPLLTGQDREDLILHAARHVAPAIQGSWNAPSGNQGYAIEWAAELTDPTVRDPLIYGLYQGWLQYAADRNRKEDPASQWEQHTALADDIKAVIGRARRDFTPNSTP